jgi:glycosyltransferase involved in cell wall biosynthesis
MEKVSVAIITKNEERNIRDCLESVTWADEIVVVDNGSTDGTREICQTFSVRFFTEGWKGYSGQKNSAIEKARNDWVLSLDADERVSSGLSAEIRQVLEEFPLCYGYFIPRKNYFLGRWIRYCGWYPDFNLRLFRKSMGRFREREVHEKVEIQGTVGFLKNPLEHITYRSLDDFLVRMNRYSTLAALQIRKEGRRYKFYDLLRPPFTFLHMYVLRGGFLEGYLGFLLSMLYAFYTLVKYSRLREFQEKENL